MPLRAIARLIQTMLYAKRFFPYYVYNILGGIEEDGQSFHPVHALPNFVRIACHFLPHPIPYSQSILPNCVTARSSLVCTLVRDGLVIIGLSYSSRLVNRSIFPTSAFPSASARNLSSASVAEAVGCNAYAYSVVRRGVVKQCSSCIFERMLLPSIFQSDLFSQFTARFIFYAPHGYLLTMAVPEPSSYPPCCRYLSFSFGCHSFTVVSHL
jgi:hypothetical protein